jgi:hypothetical protein
MMHGPMNVKSPNNTIKWQMGFNSAFKGLNKIYCTTVHIIWYRVFLIFVLFYVFFFVLCIFVLFYILFVL